MLGYDPEVKPDPQEWLSIDETERIALCKIYHHDSGVEIPGGDAHAVMHALIENQIAEGLESVVRAEKRLQEEDGLPRHEAIHAIGSIAATRIFGALKNGTPFDPVEYDRAMDQLTGASWYANAGVPRQRPVLGRIRSKRRKKPS